MTARCSVRRPSFRFSLIVVVLGMTGLLGGCDIEPLYSGPSQPPDQIARIRTHQDIGLLNPVGDFRIIAVDDVPWAKGRGVMRGTIAPGHRRIKFSYRYARCRAPTTAEAAGMVVQGTGAVIGNVLFNADVFDVYSCPSVTYGIDGIVPLNAQPAGDYLLVAERELDVIYVHVEDRKAKTNLGQVYYYKTRMIAEAP
ncbi:hypothetical protein QKW60_11100 [Defluviimonas aestuarii]|uniref:hypothetical protein n=1 Tax=Albidovulum aestuarii TaxID=1130726 RepID=UPI00249C26D4|nr:hypothetical protein [Defluviimonas aestuarii]MDI3336959.1 hypothetical protein [Defluviimonas aestuarii]